MRIVHVLDRTDAIGGVQTYLGELVPGLAGRGHESVVVAAEGGADSFAGAPVRLVAGIGADGPRLPSDVLGRLDAALAAARPDACYVHIAPSPSVARTAAAHAPVVLYAHDYFLTCPGNARYLERSGRFCAEGAGLRCLVRAYTERSTNRRPDRLARAYRRVRAWPAALPLLARVFAASPFVADVLADAGVPPDRVRVLPYPVAPAAPREPIAADVDVLFVGRLVASKGVDVLLEALARLDGATAVVAGDGPERPKLEQRAAELGLGARVRFLGWIDAEERRDLLARSRLFALPSRWQEPFGIVGVEALAAGVPVVATAVGGVPSWLDDGVDGLIVPPGDAEAFVGALGRLLGDDALRDRYGAAGPAQAVRFSLARHLDLLLAELTEVVR